jgi:thiol-disulfide isomerase/thioredoxin
VATASCLIPWIVLATSCTHRPGSSTDDGPRSAVPGAGKSAAVVLLFIAPDCPISNAYAPEIGRLVNDYEGRGVAFVAVYADPRVTEDAARRHVQEFSLNCEVRLDARQELAHHVGATVTPEAAVVDHDGGIAYLGRIDDLFAGFGKRRVAATTHELRDALDAVLGGQPVARPRVAALGCEIPPP